MPLLPHSRLGPYEVIGLLGAGGMGEVYRARDTRLGRDVAIKVLPERAAADTARRRRFEQEARAASALNHPNICTIHDIDEQDGAPYIIMELLEGLPLREALSQGPLPPSRLLQAATQVADALEAAHAAGIIHRDLTPANIFLTTRGDAKVLDFGLAKLHAGEEPACDREATTATADPPLTAAGRMLGTPGYASPEQTLGLPLDCRSDLFSFGAVLYEMATGRRAFSGENPALAGDAVVHASPPPVPSVNPAAPRGLAAIIDKAIEKDPALRYQSAAELKADLRRVARDAGQATPATPGVSATAGGATFRSGSPVMAGTPQGRRRLVWALLVVIAVGATAGLSLLWVDRPDGPAALPESVTREVTRGSRVATQPALSPDAHTIAYVVDEGPQPGIWMVETRGGMGTPWTKMPGPHRHPAWAPDGRIFFESGTGERQGIYVAPGFDSEKAILVVPGGREPSVSPDGTRLAYVRVGDSGYSRVHVTDVGNWSNDAALSADSHGRWDHTGPAWSPDGRQLCYAAADGLWTVAAHGGIPTPLSKGVDAHPAWSTSGFIYFSSLRGGVWQLWRATPDGRHVQRVTHGVGVEQMPAVSRDGRVLVFSTASDEADITIRDLAGGPETALGGGGYKNFPSFAPDARSLVFLLSAWNRRNLWEQPLAAGKAEGAPRPMTAPTQADDRGIASSQPAVSPDGRWVAYLEIDGDARDVCVMPFGGGACTHVTHHPAADYLPAWAPDSRQLAFTSERDGDQHVWIQGVRDGQPAGAPARLSTGSAPESGPAWSPDGSRIAFVTGSGITSEVAIAGAASPSSPMVVTSGARAQRVRWTARRGWLLIAGRWSSDRFVLRAFDPGRREYVRAFADIDLGQDPQALAFDVSSDERYLALVRLTRSGQVGVLEARTGAY